MEFQLVHIKFPKKMLERLDERVEDGQAGDRSELIRMAVVRYLEQTGASA